jgi:hypothetical protein
MPSCGVGLAESRADLEGLIHLGHRRNGDLAIGLPEPCPVDATDLVTQYDAVLRQTRLVIGEYLAAHRWIKSNTENGASNAFSRHQNVSYSTDENSAAILRSNSAFAA